MEKKTFKTMTFGEKLEHIWEYYKLAILAVVFIVVVVVYAIVKVVTPEPDIVMNALLVNSNSFEVSEEDAFDSYLKENGYDIEHETINVNTALYMDTENGGQASVTSYQALIAMVMVGEIDLLVADEGVISMIGVGQGLLEMEEVLPPELLEKYQDRLYTVEDIETGATYICGIRLSEGHLLQQNGYYGGEILAAIPYSAVNKDVAKEVLLYLLGE